MLLPSTSGGPIEYLTPTSGQSTAVVPTTPASGGLISAITGSAATSATIVGSISEISNSQSVTLSTASSASSSIQSVVPTSINQNTTAAHLSSNLSAATKVKIGIGAGVPAFAILVGLFLWLLVKQCRKRRVARNIPPIEQQIRPQSQQFNAHQTAAGRNHESGLSSVGYESLAGEGCKSELPTDNEIRSPVSTYHTIGSNTPELGSGRDHVAYELPG